jgi:hypothetical protein
MIACGAFLLLVFLWRYVEGFLALYGAVHLARFFQRRNP